MNQSVENPCIFFLDNDPIVSAQSLFDEDLKATILYLAIVTSQAVKEMTDGSAEEVEELKLRQKDGHVIYQTDIEPPFDYDVRWIESTPSIWKWCADYFRAMLAEHEQRFETKHPSHDIVHLFDSDGELEKDQVDEFVPPSISAIDSKYHVDANFRTLHMFNEKSKSKTKFKVSVLNTCRNLYKNKYNDDKSGCDYTKREVPHFIIPPTPENTVRAGRGIAPSWAPHRANGRR